MVEGAVASVPSDWQADQADILTGSLPVEDIRDGPDIDTIGQCLRRRRQSRLLAYTVLQGRQFGYQRRGKNVGITHHMHIRRRQAEILHVPAAMQLLVE